MDEKRLASHGSEHLGPISNNGPETRPEATREHRRGHTRQIIPGHCLSRLPVAMLNRQPGAMYDQFQATRPVRGSPIDLPDGPAIEPLSPPEWRSSASVYRKSSD